MNYSLEVGASFSSVGFSTFWVFASRLPTRSSTMLHPTLIPLQVHLFCDLTYSCVALWYT